MHQTKIGSKAHFQKLLLFLTAWLLAIASFAQSPTKNLVPNPSFEIHKGKSPLIKNAIPWMNEGTVDYYLKIDKKDTSVFKGPHSGKCYAGLRFQANYKEYMYVKLIEPLVKGNPYKFEMYVRLLDKSTVSVKQLGVYFSDNPFRVGMEFDDEGIVDSTYKKGISGTHGWVPIRGKYIAKGGEKYIIVGNFKTVMKDDFVRKNKWEIFEMREAYYYVDDISVLRPDTLISTKPEKKAAPTLPDKFVTGQVIQIKNVQFENGSAVITKASFKALDELVNTLNKYPFMEIQINGHTDNQGKETANLKLSKERSKAVYNYLLEQGVINPMKYEGFGSSKPIVSNDTEENKAKNRRVEFVIIKQQ